MSELRARRWREVWRGRGLVQLPRRSSRRPRGEVCLRRRQPLDLLARARRRPSKPASGGCDAADGRELHRRCAVRRGRALHAFGRESADVQLHLGGHPALHPSGAV